MGSEDAYMFITDVSSSILQPYHVYAYLYIYLKYTFHYSNISYPISHIHITTTIYAMYKTMNGTRGRVVSFPNVVFLTLCWTRIGAENYVSGHNSIHPHEKDHNIRGGVYCVVFIQFLQGSMNDVICE